MRRTVAVGAHAVIVAAGSLVGAATSALASNITWNSTNSQAWEVATNWSPTTASPGSADQAFFKGSKTSTGADLQLTVLPNSGAAVAYITFQTGTYNSVVNAGNYTIGSTAGNTLKLARTDGAGTVAIDPALALGNIVERVDAPLELYGSYQFSNSAADSTTVLRLNGAISSAVGTSTDIQLKGINAGDNAVTGVVSDGTAGSVIRILKMNAGTWTLSGANTYTGATQVQQGILKVSSINSTAIASRMSSSSLGAPTTATNGMISLGSLANTGQLTYNGSGETTDRILKLAGTTGGGVVDQSGTGLLKFTSNFDAGGNGSKTLTLQGSSTGSGEIAGVIRDYSGSATTALVKLGTGVWTLSAANTYTGGTQVNGGTILANNSSGSATGAGTVKVAGVLGGTGTISGVVTVHGGGAIGGGNNSAAKLTLSAANAALTMESGAKLNLTIAGTTESTSSSLIDLSGLTSSIVLGMGNSYTLNVANLGGTGLNPTGKTFNLIHYTGADPSLSDLGSWSVVYGSGAGSWSGGTLGVDEAGNYITLSAVTVPEPTVAGLVFGAVAMGLLTRRRGVMARQDA